MANLIFYIILATIILPIVIIFIIGLEQGWKGTIKWKDDEISSGRWIDGK